MPQDSLPLFPDPASNLTKTRVLPDDLAELFKDVPEGRMTSISTSTLKTIQGDPLVTEALSLFGGSITDILIPGEPAAKKKKSIGRRPKHTDVDHPDLFTPKNPTTSSVQAILQGEGEIGQRHTVEAGDPARDYIISLERSYMPEGDNPDETELAKVMAISLTPETIHIGGIVLHRKNHGKMNYLNVQRLAHTSPTIPQWEAIFAAIPGGDNWHAVMKALLGIELNRNLWTHDTLNRPGMISIETQNIATRRITRDDNALGMATLFCLSDMNADVKA